jgi:hypothetical protein
MNYQSHTAAGRCRLTAFFVIALLCVANANAMADAVVNFDDIDFWVGSGANQAALALDWQGDATTDNSLVWGFRWDGNIKAVNMITAIIAADDRLFAKLGGIGGFGTGVVGLGYDANDDGQFAITDDTFFDEQGLATSGPVDGAESVDAGDWYAEGWFITGFWQYGVATGNPYDGGTWARSGSGISSRDVLNQSWHSLAFSPSFSNQAFARNPLAAETDANADFDGDGDIDGRDFLAWQRGESPASLSSDDLINWQNIYGIESFSALPLPPSALTSVLPEPSTGLLLLTFIFMLPRLLHHDRRNVS